MKGGPSDLLPGDPVCAPIRTVLTESTVALVRSLSEYPLWKDHVASAILKGLGGVKSVSMLRFDHENLQKEGPQTEQEGFTEDDSGVTMQVRTMENIQGLPYTESCIFDNGKVSCLFKTDSIIKPEGTVRAEEFLTVLSCFNERKHGKAAIKNVP